MGRRISFKPYDSPAGGWGSAKSLGSILSREGVPISGTLALSRQNKVDGFQCVSCAWPKPANPLPFEFCENGAKATAWEITTHRCTPEFFAEHTVTELLDWDDYHLEQAGRLTQPMRYDPGTDKYRPVSWSAAFAEIGRELRAIADRKSVVFYSSGRSSNEASYLYGLFARLYGNNNLPDSSNMCHETTSVALPESIGVPVGTVRWRTSRRPIASCSSDKIPAATVRACCIRCRKRASGACRSSRIIRCGSGGWRVLPIRSRRWRC